MALRLKAKCKITAVPLSSRMALFRLGLTCVRVEISHSVPASHPAGRSPSRRRGGVPAAWPPLRSAGAPRGGVRTVVSLNKLDVGAVLEFLLGCAFRELSARRALRGGAPLWPRPGPPCATKCRHGGGAGAALLSGAAQSGERLRAAAACAASRGAEPCLPAGRWAGGWHGAAGFVPRT